MDLGAVAVVVVVVIGVCLSGRQRRHKEEHSNPVSSFYSSAQSTTWQPLSDRPAPPFHPAPRHPVWQPSSNYPAPSFQPVPRRSVPSWKTEQLNKARETGQQGEEKVRRELHSLQLDALHDIILVDDRGPTQIDHVVKTPSGFVVLETKNYTGFIFGRWDSSSWTQRIEHDGKEHDIPFQNPVRQNFRHRKAVEHAIGESSIAVASYVVFVGDAKIGDSVASRILKFDKLGHTLWSSERPRANSGNLEAAWERLRLAAQRGELRRDEHLAMLRSRPEWPDEHIPF